jgi:hypothetical protein
MMPCIQADLQRLSKTTPVEAAEQGLPQQRELQAFKTEYTVIFAALDAKFGLIPSNSQIANQVHSGLENSLKEGVLYAFTCVQQSFLVNIEYHHGEVCQKLFGRKNFKQGGY